MGNIGEPPGRDCSDTEPTSAPQFATVCDERARRGAFRRSICSGAVAKDAEKLIRQLSLISFLMANRRPVSALKIKREVEAAAR